MNAPTLEPRPRVILDPALESIGYPKVIVSYQGGSAFVRVKNCPWGWGNVGREFLNPDSPGVMRYAEKLMGRLQDEAQAKDEYNAKRRLRGAIGRSVGQLSGMGTPRNGGRR